MRSLRLPRLPASIASLRRLQSSGSKSPAPPSSAPRAPLSLGLAQPSSVSASSAVSAGKDASEPKYGISGVATLALLGLAGAGGVYLYYGIFAPEEGSKLQSSLRESLPLNVQNLLPEVTKQEKAAPLVSFSKPTPVLKDTPSASSGASKKADATSSAASAVVPSVVPPVAVTSNAAAQLAVQHEFEVGAERAAKVLAANLVDAEMDDERARVIKEQSAAARAREAADAAEAIARAAEAVEAAALAAREASDAEVRRQSELVEARVAEAEALGRRPESVAATARHTAQTALVQSLQEALKSDMRSTLGSELDGLSESQLRARVLRLSEELHDRARWEAVRMSEFLDRAETQWGQRFEEYARVVSAEGSKAVALHRRQLETELQKHYTDLFEREKSRLTAVVRGETEVAIRAAREGAAAEAGAAADKAAAELRGAQAYLAAADLVLASRESNERAAARTTRLATAVLALCAALERPGAITQEAAALKVAAGGDAVMSRALRLLPDSAFTSAGVATHTELRARWDVVSVAGRRAALTPEGSGALGQAVGAAQAALVLPATQLVEATRSALAPVLASATRVASAAQDLAGQVTELLASAGLYGKAEGKPTNEPPPVATPSPSSPLSDSPVLTDMAKRANAARQAVVDTANETALAVISVNGVFDRAQACVDAGDLAGAVRVLGPLSGSAGAAVREWAVAASDRVEADQAARVARARATLLAAAMY